MKKLNEILFSMLTSVILLATFGASIAYATFAESSSGTEYAKSVVYNAKWFEVLLVLLVVNLLGSVIRYKIFNMKKFSVLLFHFAFILMLAGAAITRYFGYEGIMHIRQGETSNEISSDKTSVGITAEYKGEKVEKASEATFSENASNDFSEKLQIGGKTITVENELYVLNSIETVVPDDQGEPAVSLFVMNHQNMGGMDLILLNGETNKFEDVSFALNNVANKSDVSFSVVNNQLFFTSTMPVTKTSMMQKSEMQILPGNITAIDERTIYKAANLIFVLKQFMPKAKKTLTQMTPDMNKSGIKRQGKNAIIFKVSDGNTTKRINVFDSDNETSTPTFCQLNDVKVSVSYGMLMRKLPFKITLNAFQLERYPGSNSPSSYASDIIVTDTEMKIVKPYRIFMNNILNYRGYRFFQSSYDQDERGTILSVNKDYWGTLITYTGYLLMAIGMLLTFFNKNSRFRTVLRWSNDLQLKRKAGKAIILAGLIVISGSLFATNAETNKKAHLNALNSLLIQDEVQGRIEPFNTYASDVLRKISKKDSYNKMSASEVLLGMSSNPASWQNEPIIKVRNEQLAKELGAIKTYVSFNQLFNAENGGAYRLKDQVDKVYQKEQSTRNEYDKEIINVDERINICYQLFNGTMLNLFPVSGREQEKWVTAKSMMPTTANGQVCPAGFGAMGGGMSGIPAPSGMNGMDGMSGMPSGGMPAGTVKAPPLKEGMQGMTPPHGMGGMSEEQLNSMMGKGAITAQQSNPNSPEVLLQNYLKAANEAFSNGNWAPATEKLLLIKNYQLQNGGNNLPSSSKVSLEIAYNKLNIFNQLGYIYTFIGLILLALHLINIFRIKSGLEKVLNNAIYLFMFIFAVYSIGLSIRWYISGHAPWSNGYETMIFVGWASALSGLIFAKKSPISLAVTGILSAIALIVASMSWMNPEITNLVPVLKSYWLIIHVAIITSSYGFLAMGALLGFLNLSLMISRTKKNSDRLKVTIQEISYIIELSLIVGLFLLSIGCFIGGVWANESWGRYWGWDPKETWALVSILVYSAILHLRNVPNGTNQFILSSLSVVGFSTIIMTFFGVNYYLSGMHSYAQGSAPSVPGGVYVAVVLVFALIGWAYNSEKKNKI
jgi:cytochrome c-type biogenesis protein CcsB